MTGRYLLAVDAGTGSCRALLFTVGLVDDFRHIKPYQKLIGQIIGAAIMALSLVAIMALFWDTVRGNAFQSAEMIRAWHASGTQSFSRYLWGDNLGGVLAMTIVSLIFGGLLGTLGGALGASLRGGRMGAGLTVAASAEGSGR